MELIEYAKELANSGLLPNDFKKNPANILYAMEIAKDLDVSPVTAIRGIYTVGGKVGFTAEFMLAMAKRSGAIQAIDYEKEGDGQDLEVTATAILASGAHATATVTMREAIAEGWTRNPKYKSSPVNMLTKRATVRLISNYCPEVMCGLGAGEPEDYEETAPVQIARDPAAPIQLHRDNAHAKTRAMLARVINDSSRENCEAIAAEIEAEENQVAAVRESAPDPIEEQFSVDNKAHRALVNEVSRGFNLPQGWLTQNRAKLEDYLKSIKLEANFKAVHKAISDYLLGEELKKSGDSK